MLLRGDYQTIFEFFRMRGIFRRCRLCSRCSHPPNVWRGECWVSPTSVVDEIGNLYIGYKKKTLFFELIFRSREVYNTSCKSLLGPRDPTILSILHNNMAKLVLSIIILHILASRMWNASLCDGPHPYAPAWVSIASIDVLEGDGWVGTRMGNFTDATLQFGPNLDQIVVL